MIRSDWWTDLISVSRHSCPPVPVIKELLNSVQRVTFYGFLMALSKDAAVNGSIGEKPSILNTLHSAHRPRLLTIKKATPWTSDLIPLSQHSYPLYQWSRVVGGLVDYRTSLLEYDQTGEHPISFWCLGTAALPYRWSRSCWTQYRGSPFMASWWPCPKMQLSMAV